MEQPPALASDTIAAPSKGKIFVGLVIMVAWIFLHVVLFYVLAVSGFLLELFVGFIKSILLNDRDAFSPIGDAWEGPLKAGLILAGAAGIPLGLAKFWITHQKRIKKAFWLILLLGFLFELYALFILLSTAFTAPA